MNTPATATATANPPAFPRPASVEPDWRELESDETAVPAQQGLLLRDYFAAKALAALILRGEAQHPEVIAGAAYEYADAMLAERVKGD